MEGWLRGGGGVGVAGWGGGERGPVFVHRNLLFLHLLFVFIACCRIGGGYVFHWEVCRRR